MLMSFMKNFPNVSSYDRVIVFDTETSGSIREMRGADPFREQDKFPHIAQICYAVVDNGDWENIRWNTYFIKPEGWSMDPESEKIHHISQKEIEEQGVPIREVLTKLNHEIASVDKSLLIAHNINFDFPIVKSEFSRAGIFMSFPTTIYCTMLNSMDTMRESHGRAKWPKLCELYSYCFGKDIQDAHRADSDVKATIEILKREMMLI